MTKSLSNPIRVHRWAAVGLLLFLTASAPGGVLSAMNIESVLQERIVQGRVTSKDDNLGFPGVNILVKGTTDGTVTDSEGNFSINIRSADAVLVFSSIGYKTVELPVAGQSRIDLSMEADVTNLSEVVVVGYGTVRKSDVTGALSSVNSEQLKAVPVQSISQALQGRAAGVDIAQSSFRPGDNPTIRIRGNRSLIGGNDPLIVVDGIPLPEGSGINDFNPSDVASIEVLKDASSTAIYGSRGANGVVLVTTKKGKAGKAKVTYDAFYGVSKPLVEIEMKGAADHAELRREALRNNRALTYAFPWADAATDYANFAGQDIEVWNSVAQGYEWVDAANRIPAMRAVTTEEREQYEAYYAQYAYRYPVASRTADQTNQLAKLRAALDDPNLQIPVYNSENVRNTDWGDLALQTGKKQSHQISVAGGSENLSLYFGAGYYKEEGIQKTQGFNRYNVKLGLDYQASKIFKIGGTITGTYSDQEFGSPLYFRAIGQNPLAIPYDANGNVIFQPGGDALVYSPLNEIEDFKDDRRTARFFGSYYADVQLLKGLRYRVNLGTDFRQYRRGQYQGAMTSDRRGGTSWANLAQDQRFTYVLENLVFYNKEINNIHRFDITALYSLQDDRFEASGVNVSNLPYESQLYYNLGSTNAAGPDAFSSDFSKKVFLSYMARVNYSLMDKYLLTLTGRYDGLSPLAPGKKWGFFPSASAAWKISQESFMTNLANVVEDLKLRVGYGSVGNAGVPPYLAVGRLDKVPYVWAENPAWGYIPRFFRNPNLAWEGTTSLNAGLDFVLFGGRIDGTVEVYRQTTDDLLMWRQLPTASGFDQVLENIGKVQNSGIEISLNTVNVDMSNGFKWTTGVIFSKNKEELVELYGGTNDDLGNRWFIGHPITTYYDWQPMGVWQSSEVEEAAKFGRIPGQAKIQDQITRDTDGDGVADSGDEVINANDMVIRGNNVPDWTGSIVNTFSFKGLELSLMLYTRQGSTIASGYYRPALAGRYPEPAFVDYWTPTNPSNMYPRPTTDQERIDYPQAYLYQDGSFMKLRNITLGYTFPRDMISRFKMENLKVYFTAYNPFLWSDFKGGDPEFYANQIRLDRGVNVPITNVDDQLIGNNLSDKSFVFGLSVGF
jgi:TonB-dependent starch-binding outer membrane protein SusC